MNIKSLLLGSAAALLAVSGARAADAVDVIAEPEPMEYVRVCDTYGTGYFYIPGTETCLRIGGYVRYDIGVGDGAYGGKYTADVNEPGEYNDTYHKKARLSLRTWTGTETELGTLSTYTETRFNYDDGAPRDWIADGDGGWFLTPPGGGGTTTTLNFAWIQLGGFRVGKDESAFLTFSDYAGGVIADDIIPYGTFDTNLISYTFDAGNGFSAIISLEEGETGTDYEIDSYVPHIVAGVKYAGGWGGISVTGAYDSVYEEWAIKARADVNVNEQLSLWVMAMYGTDDDWTTNYFKRWDGNWAVFAGGAYKFSDRLTFNIQGSYAEGRDFDDGVQGDGAQFAIAANVDYEIVPDFHIIPELTYSDLDYHEPFADRPGTDGFGGWLRFQRDF